MEPVSYPPLDEAFAAIEEGILPSVSMMLEALIEAAVSGEASVNADVRATEIRSLGRQMASLTREVQIMCGPAYSPPPYGTASAA